MKKFYYSIILLFAFSCKVKQPKLNDHINIRVHAYEIDSMMRASALPEFKGDTFMMRYKRRFEYIFYNVPQIHSSNRAEKRSAIFNLYPDTTAMKQLYLDEFVKDKKLKNYFEMTMTYINQAEKKRKLIYSMDELMEVASKFFYCDRIEPDTTIIAHVCVGLNGVKEAQWKTDYTLLEAFCFEAIFDELDQNDSKIWESFVRKKKTAYELHKRNIISLSQYLENVKLDLFQKMKEDKVLKQELISYYEKNRTNLAFEFLN